MESFRLSYSKNNLLIVLMVLIPLLGTLLLLYFLLMLPKDFPDWAVYTIIFSALLLMAGAVIFVLTKKITVPCRIDIDQQGVAYQLEKFNPFYRRQHFSSAWDNISNISESSYNGQANYYQITFINPAFTINLSPIKGNELEAEQFFETISAYQENYNLAHQTSPILAKNFYQSNWARFLTWIFYAVTLTVLILLFTNSTRLDWYRPISLLCIGSIWISNYYRNTKKFY